MVRAHPAAFGWGGASRLRGSKAQWRVSSGAGLAPDTAAPQSKAARYKNPMGVKRCMHETALGGSIPLEESTAVPGVKGAPSPGAPGDPLGKGDFLLASGGFRSKLFRI